MSETNSGGRHAGSPTHKVGDAGILFVHPAKCLIYYPNFICHSN